MNRLIRFYNQNRHKIWLIIAIVIGIIALIQVLNKMALERNNADSNINDADNSSKLNNNYSVITGQEVKQEVKDIIDEFIDFCNNGQIEEAYEILSEECKEILYPTLNDFNVNYYSKIFSKKKSYICQAWISQNNIYTYRIDFTEDMLATGSSSKSSIIDYYTVVKVNDEYKLNINKLIGTEIINNTGTSRGITINIKRRVIYMDYEIYDLEVTNNSAKIMVLDDLQSSNRIYVEDADGEQYFWYNHEITEEELTVDRGFNKEISIKFNKSYRVNNSSKMIVFQNIIIDNSNVISIKIDV